MRFLHLNTSTRSRLRRTLLVAASSAAAVLTPVQRISGQDKGWNGHAEASANVIFGSSRSRLATMSGGFGRADSTLEVRTDVLVGYADARIGDDDRHRVTSRHTRFSFGVDHHPLSRFSPFVLGSVATNLQQRIEYRASGGAGAKFTLRRVKDDEASVSAAMLWERTSALYPDSGVDPITTRIRWSLRLRGKHKFSNGVQLSHVTFYQPVVDDASRYTTDSNTTAALSLNQHLALTLTSRTRFDSEARGRGARTNLDGELVFGLRTSF